MRKTAVLIGRALAALCLIVIFVGPVVRRHCAYAQEETGGALMATEPISARLQMESYGFEAKVMLNAQAIEIKSGSTSRIFFSKDHPQMQGAPAQAVAKYGILQEGVNKIEVEYKNTDPDFKRLECNIYIPGYPAPVFYLYGKERGADKITAQFPMSAKPASDFQPVFAYENTGCIFIKTAGCNLESKLNGKKLMQNLGVPESTTGFEFAAKGGNKLEVKIKSDKKQLVEYAVVTYKGVEIFSQELAADEEVIKTYEF